MAIPLIIDSNSISFILDNRFFRFFFSKDESRIKISLKKGEKFGNIDRRMKKIRTTIFYNSILIYCGKLTKLTNKSIYINKIEETSNILIKFNISNDRLNFSF